MTQHRTKKNENNRCTGPKLWVLFVPNSRMQQPREESDICRGGEGGQHAVSASPGGTAGAAETIAEKIRRGNKEKRTVRRWCQRLPGAAGQNQEKSGGCLGLGGGACVAACTCRSPVLQRREGKGDLVPQLKHLKEHTQSSRTSVVQAVWSLLRA